MKSIKESETVEPPTNLVKNHSLEFLMGWPSFSDEKKY